MATVDEPVPSIFSDADIRVSAVFRSSSALLAVTSNSLCISGDGIGLVNNFRQDVQQKFHLLIGSD